MSYTLVADIGGTNSRFAKAGQTPREITEIHEIQNDNHDDFDSTFEEALSFFDRPIDKCVFAVAGPVLSGEALLTNRGWKINANALTARHRVGKISVINDFTAQALSLPFLNSSGTRVLLEGTDNHEGHKLVVGAGTGLGVGMLFNVYNQWYPVQGEGGHVSLPIESTREFDVLAQLSEIHEGRVSAERVLSGPGLIALYNVLAKIDDSDLRVTRSSEVVSPDRSDDTFAIEAMRLFSTWLGRVVGDHALSILPVGGIYISGGLAPVVLENYGIDCFIDQCLAKGRVSSSLKNIPIRSIVDPAVGLIGAAAAASRHSDIPDN